MAFTYSAQFFMFSHHPFTVFKTQTFKPPEQCSSCTWCGKKSCQQKIHYLSIMLYLVVKWGNFTPAWIPTKLNFVSQGTVGIMSCTDKHSFCWYRIFFFLNQHKSCIFLSCQREYKRPKFKLTYQQSWFRNVQNNCICPRLKLWQT